ncbi:beta-glucoside-specific PTS transporter subunit IIABC [Olsenella sp. YH-ols2217]|uniref:Beta-glucoside-specific PTS transporter subunit IIABC n=1 Tax=Kribbibacterium absianum TaxID=3044210 RepID=A0ABT6ZL54_9ACTN|nr:MULTISPECIES: beta-glucoside-specific PTS transporter subunit IIABC [unclassified Olsenella]MDJ1121765.1 beta-glucoside-specific PTS transporter subunit IIABC [Olsenella sp. YH-ols2216]MDJ1129773.1 beta-glucoside-specific PTS transporter subunit IIABC [Olsenella sp. YH-ols2217]
MASTSGTTPGAQILELVGGQTNVQSVAHCATRLRFRLSDEGRADTKAIEALPDVISVVQQGGQYQVVIGPAVGTVYDQVLACGNVGTAAAAPPTDVPAEKKSLLNLALDTITAIFTPLLSLMAGAGLLRGCVLLFANLGLLDTAGSTYLILDCASQSVFNFLPLLLAWTAAKRFDCSPFVAVCIMASLLMPSFTTLVDEMGTGAVASFFGLPVMLQSYASTVFPALIAVWVFSKLEKWLKRVVPEMLQLAIVPLVSLLVMVPLTAAVFGPIGVYLGNGIGAAIDALMAFSPWLCGAVVGGFWNVFVLLGVHWGVVPIMIQQVSASGSSIVVAMAATANFAVSGVALAVFLRSRKDKEVHQFSLSAVVTALVAGVTEPAVYGILLRFKKCFVASIIGGAVGGAIVAAFNAVAYASTFGSLLNLPAFVGPNFVWFLVGIAAALVVACAIVLVTGYQNSEEEPAEQSGSVSLPVSGDVQPLSTCSDNVFASGAMGTGCLVTPSEGKLYAPFDGEVTMLFETGHAVGLTANDGTEVLVHIGIDTVQLEGKPFSAHVKQGDRVSAGQLLMDIDLAQIQASGRSIETPILVTNANGREVRLATTGQHKHGDAVLELAEPEAEPSLGAAVPA